MRRETIHRTTGALSAALGAYCLALVASSLLNGWPKMSLMLAILGAIYGACYLIFGAASLLSKPGAATSFAFFGFILFSGWLENGVSPHIVPILILPFVILGLTAAMLAVEWRGGWDGTE